MRPTVPCIRDHGHESNLPVVYTLHVMSCDIASVLRQFLLLGWFGKFTRVKCSAKNTANIAVPPFQMRGYQSIACDNTLLTYSFEEETTIHVEMVQTTRLQNKV